jgi:formylmethanofuran dehydrogenase subunit E
MVTIEKMLEASAILHSHLCPRQVLGVRMGMCAGRILGLALPQTDKRLLTFMETDGCAADGVAVATGCRVGRRTMRIVDFGKVAATFVDTLFGSAIRIHPHPDTRTRAAYYVVKQPDRWHTQLLAYQIMPDDALLVVEHVELSVSLQAIVSQPWKRVVCQVCGEEIMNEREVVRESMILCRSCAGMRYYLVCGPSTKPGDAARFDTGLFAPTMRRRDAHP